VLVLAMNNLRTNALNKIRVPTQVKLLRVSAPKCHSKGAAEKDVSVSSL
jgi:hypothetical protein